MGSPVRIKRPNSRQYASCRHAMGSGGMTRPNRAMQHSNSMNLLAPSQNAANKRDGLDDLSISGLGPEM